MTQCDNKQIDLPDLDFVFQDIAHQDIAQSNSLEIRDLDGYLATIEKTILVEILDHLEWNRRKVAQHLGLSDRQLRYKLIKYELSD